MGRIKFVGVLVTPSLASVLFCSGISAFMLLIATLSYNARTGFLYDLFFGPNSSTEVIQAGRNTVDTIFDTTFSNPVLNKLVFFAFWCLVGLVIYMLLTGLGKTSVSLSDTAHRLFYFSAKRQVFEEDIGKRLIIASVALLLGFIYSIFFIQTLLPFSILCGRIGIGNLNNISGWLYTLGAFVVFGLGIYIFIVILRLLLLKPRLFGGGETLVDSEVSERQHQLK